MHDLLGSKKESCHFNSKSKISLCITHTASLLRGSYKNVSLQVCQSFQDTEN